MAEVANPAVIIGLGGTGKWVLTYIKKNLLDTYSGEMPRTVRLLSFDTTTEKVSREGVAQEEDARVGDVQLDKNAEFVYLGGNIQQICRDIRDRREYPHIGSWLQASTYLQTADSDAFDIARGAGQKRPFGRMSIFYNLQKAVQAEVINKIETAIREVIGANQRQTSIEIYVIASLAGGTGAGMFIDVAHLARWFANRQIRTGYAVRGFLALHNSFRAVIRTEQIQANAFAAMRELDRFMLVFDQQYPIVYNPTNPVLNTIYGGQLGKLFDNCYLLDASRENLPLDNFLPKYGVYPSMADCISMLLDGSTGDAYAQHYKNVNTRIGEVQSQLKQPIYSSLGTYSLILPVEDMISTLTHRFALDLLGQHLLNLESRTNDAGQVQYVLRYDGDAKQDAAAFLRATKSVSGTESTNFIQRVPSTVEKGSPGNAAYELETAHLEASELLTWVLPPETDPIVSELARKIREDLETTLHSRVLSSKEEKDDPVDGCNRIINQVRDFKEEYLGRDVGGKRTGGLYRNALEQCVAIQRDRYRKLLQEHLLILLNGSAPENKDYQGEKQGKLGKAQALLGHLSLYFADQAAFLTRVRNRRAKQEDLRTAQEDASLKRSDMIATKERTNFLGMFSDGLKVAIKAQQAYIDAEQGLTDVEVTELFFDFLQQASETLRSVTEEYKGAVDGWIATLAQGFTGTFTDTGLYRALESSAKRHAAYREDKKRIEVHEYVTNDAYETDLYRNVTEGKFAEAMTRLTWGADQHDNLFRLSLSGLNLAGAGSSGGRSATERNADFLLSIGHSYMEALRDLTIAERLKERDPLRLATMLLDKCSPLIKFDPSKIGGSQEMHYFVCVNEGRQKAYFNELRDSLRRLGTSAKDNQVLDSSNPYTCTILATADVLASQGLLAYTSAEREYNNHLGDARLLHCFPAEVNAVQLEQQLPKIKESRRRFSHVLTTMLEDRRIVEQFILAHLYDFIRLEKVEGINNRWTLFLPGTRRREEDYFALTPAERQPSLFQAMETFVFRKSDFNNPVQTIDFEHLNVELRRYEDQASAGDESRLINLLEAVIDRDIEPLRREPDPKQRDLGSLMRLVVDEIIEGLHARLKADGRRYDRDAVPIVAQAAPVVPSPVVAVPVSNGNGSAARVALPAPTDEGVTATTLVEHKSIAVEPEPSAAVTRSFKEELRDLKETLDEGFINQKEYDELRKEILKRMRGG